MWGAKKGILSDIKKLINEFDKGDFWQTDQNFLNSVVSPIVEKTTLLHDSINLKNFPTKRENFHFVGEIFDGSNNRAEHWTVFQLPEYKNLI